jgi:hypothetical protein
VDDGGNIVIPTQLMRQQKNWHEVLLGNQVSTLDYLANADGLWKNFFIYVRIIQVYKLLFNLILMYCLSGGSVNTCRGSIQTKIHSVQRHVTIFR